MSLIYAFSKQVKWDRVFHQGIADPGDMVKIEQVIEKLEALPKALKLKLDELDLRTNPKAWATSLIKGYPNNVKREEEEYLLFDFTEPMKTRMREESKYAIGLLMPSKLFLCHSLFGEETITPEWKIIPRMLDTDNVLRYVCFMDDNGIITVRFWEREATSSFIEWLGLPRKQAFLFGGRYRIQCEVEGVTVELQLTEEEIEGWLDSHPELRQGTVKFSKPIELFSVNEIRAGRKRYESPQDFIQDFRAENYGITRYQKEYENISSGNLPLLFKYYDEKTRVVKKEGDEEITVVTKAIPQFDILFINEHIEFRESYLSDLVKRFINGEQIDVAHAGLKFKEPPSIIGNMKIYNEIRLGNLTQQMVDYYNGVNLQDRNLSRLIEFAIFKRLSEINSGLPICHFFGRIGEKLSEVVCQKGKWTKLEDEVLEYKSGDFFAGKNEEIIAKLSDDLHSKLEMSSFKVYFIGVEDNGAVNPLSLSKWKSDRIEAIRKGLEEILSPINIFLCPIIEGDGVILLFSALAKVSSTH